MIYTNNGVNWTRAQIAQLLSEAFSTESTLRQWIKNHFDGFDFTDTMDKPRIIEVFLDTCYKDKKMEIALELLRKTKPDHYNGIADTIREQNETNAKINHRSIKYIVVAMTKEQAGQLMQGDILISEKKQLMEKYWQTFYGDTDHSWVHSYGNSPDEWKPYYAHETTSIRDILSTLTAQANSYRERIGLPLLDLSSETDRFWSANEEGKYDLANELLSGQVLLVIDGFSLFHPEIEKDLKISPLVTTPHHALTIITPHSKTHVDLEKLIRSTVYPEYKNVFIRYNSKLDELCDISIKSVIEVKRWLFRTFSHGVRENRMPASTVSTVEKSQTYQDLQITGEMPPRLL